jgi:23S rRNA (pseudouridine1915-N3)-methyltransferase
MAELTTFFLGILAAFIEPSPIKARKIRNFVKESGVDFSRLLAQTIGMHHFIIRAIGRPHEPWHPQAIHKYVEALRPFASIELIELDEAHQGSARPNVEETKKREGERLLQSLPAHATIVALDERGVNDLSTRFAARVQEWADGGRPVVFLLGGSWGLSDDVRARAQHLLSFGKHTLPHLFARITLLEQLYRAETILCGKEYHK